jgi:ATP-dependent Lhr-like helicase
MGGGAAASRRAGGRGGGAFQGRWSLLPTQRASLVERQQAAAEALLDCWGVLTRDAVNSRGVVGGFSAVYAELGRAEELGLVRRGYFVDGLGGAQFALPEAVDRLRAEQHVAPPDPSREPVVMLRASDPAQPYGTIIDWPERDGLPKPSRTAVAYVALRAGALLAHLNHAGKVLNVYEPDALPAIAAALAELVRSGRLDRIAIERIDGAPLASDHVAAFANTGFVRTPLGVQATTQTVSPDVRPGVRGASGSSPVNQPGTRGGDRLSGGGGKGPDVANPTHGRQGRYGHPHDPRQH